MHDETVSADSIIARFKAMRSELARLKRRQYRLELRLKRLRFLQFSLRVVRFIVKLGYDVVYLVKKLVGHNHPLSTKKPSKGDQT